MKCEPDRIILESAGRGTAPAAAVAAILLEDREPGAMMLLLPSDHIIGNQQAFRAAVQKGRIAAGEGALVTFGITPSAPETGYGYIRRGDAFPGAEDCYRIDEFTEKPGSEQANGYLASGLYDWNSGIFLFRTDAYLEELGRLKPEMLAACRKAVTESVTDLDFFRLGEDAFLSVDGQSIDHAVMEATDKAATVHVDMGWNDVGSWSALWELGDKDSDGNVVVGDVITSDVRDSYLRLMGN